jgi:hypothetical protein
MVHLRFYLVDLIGIEPTASALQRQHSTAELQAHTNYIILPMTLVMQGLLQELQLMLGPK